MITTIFEFIKSYVSIIDVIDIAFISYIIYRILLLLRGTRAIYMLVSIMILLVLLGLSDFLGMRVTRWVLSNMSGYLFLALIIVFQPEIRRALAFIGESKFFERSITLNSQIVDELVRTATILANRQLGALIIIQRNTDITHYVTLGQKIDSVVSKDLLLSILFHIHHYTTEQYCLKAQGLLMLAAFCRLQREKILLSSMEQGTGQL